ncbi:hypothetical protein ACJIZ3_018233 [Penstemon smallii]|uniref:DCD domain-containing protein n=1 Tax=Penstemon smallii TaxID=265156 RepID=A0ABD3SXS0_9LAMI
MVWTDPFSGYIFMCNGKTKLDCYKYRVFGLPAGRLDVVKKIKPQTKLFLFDFDLKLLYGVYTSSTQGEMGIEPSAFGGKFPAQVKFEIFKDCLPLPESVFKHAIIDNYRGGRKFRQELSNEQVNNLVAMFTPLPLQPLVVSNIQPNIGLSSYDQHSAKLQHAPLSLVSDSQHGQQSLTISPFMYAPHGLRAHPYTQSDHVLPLAPVGIDPYIPTDPEHPTLFYQQARDRHAHGRAALLPGRTHHTAAYWVAMASEDRRHAYVSESVRQVPCHSVVMESDERGNGPQSVIAAYGSHNLAHTESSLTSLQNPIALHGAMHLASSSSASINYYESPKQGHRDSHGISKESTGIGSENVPNSRQEAVETRISELVRSLHCDNMIQYGSYNDATVPSSHASISTHTNVPLQNYESSHGFAHPPHPSLGVAAYWAGVACQEARDPNQVTSANYMSYGNVQIGGSFEAYAQVPVLGSSSTTIYGTTQWPSSAEAVAASGTEVAYVEHNQAHPDNYQMLPLSR